ncbi:MAG TPA: DUF5060 domain-containing protein [Trueperaceae bacterium]|nr:DUF5060 domain-containing protein [Trueperaceae bacterium]
MTTRRSGPFGYVYAAVLACVALYGYVQTGYVPRPTALTDVFPTALPVGGVPAVAGAPAQGDAAAPSRVFAPRSVGLFQTVDFAVPVPPAQLAGRSSLFDVEADATFSNSTTGDSFVTEAFYDGGADGNAIYTFRFTPTSLGTWTLATTSDVPALAGLQGTVDVVPASDPATYGFLTTADGRFAAPVAGTGELEGIAYQVFMHGGSPLEDLGALPTEDGALRLALTALLDEAASYGFDAVFVGVWHQWFALGTSRSDLHDSVDPDPATFRVLEILCSMAHERGMFVHIWQWGDEQRLWSPLGITADGDVTGDGGGVNGVADRRLQRYIAARLGPLPNWVLGYGFDLYEWADEEQVRSWAGYLSERLARPHLLTAIEQRRSARSLFDLGDTTLGLVSDAAAAETALAAGGSPSAALYGAAVNALEAAGGKPVIFENRFLYEREGLWTMDETRRSLWALTLAGGVAAIWGVDWDLQALFSDPEQLLTFRAFWSGRLDGELRSSAEVDGSLRLLSAAGDRGVIYAEGADAIAVPALPSGVSVSAVDTLVAYKTVPVAIPASGQDGLSAPFLWRAPYSSDWALALDAPLR